MYGLLGIHLTKLFSMTTDAAPAMIGKKTKGIASLLKKHIINHGHTCNIINLPRVFKSGNIVFEDKKLTESFEYNHNSIKYDFVQKNCITDSFVPK